MCTVRNLTASESELSTPRATWVLMVVAAILGVAAVIAIPQYIKSQARREVAQLKAQVRAQPALPVAVE